ncbi:hypothetical protein GGI07_000348 [Coemansia sp. Benny D115]|nr:hypothetical protein GGI07_000348 [Coemansia sp. Benny D115]
MSPKPTADSSEGPLAMSNLLSRFRLREVLNEDSGSKTIWLLGVIVPAASSNAVDSDPQMLVPGQNAALVTLERLAFASQGIEKADSTLLGSTEIASEEHNDIYSWATGVLVDKAFRPDSRVSITYPATLKHIVKHRRQQRVWVKETPEQYLAITRPFIDSQPASRLQWVYNILSKQTEAERIVFEDPDPESGFIILPDLKWDATNPDNMYLVAIVHRRDIKSLRDLTPEHLPLLKNIREKSAAAARVYGVPPEQLRLYIHYQPSYYHFHVHITNVNFEGKGMLAGRAHLLDTVIDNIEHILPNYYQKATLPFALASGDDLWKHWAEN